jgi:Zn-dependent protease with chaperone function
LLVTFVLCGTAALFGAMAVTSPEATNCASRLWSGVLMPGPEASGDGRDAAARAAMLLPMLVRCLGTMRFDAVLRVAGIGLVTGVAILLYYFHPGRMQRRRRLEPLGTSGLGELEQELQRLVERAGLERAPTFLWSPLASGLPIVFGRSGRHYVALSGAFVVQYFYRNRDGFRAVILHELAHIQNGDVGKTHFTWALWRAFVGVVLAPAVAVFLWRLAQALWSDAAAILFTGVLWTTVIVLSGLAVLRVREYYADVRASAWDQGSRIDGMLAVLAAPAGGGWRRWLRFHPDPQQRRDIVKDPSELLRLGFADVLGIGIATWSVIAVVSNLLIYLLPREPTLAFVYFAGIKLVVPGAVFILGVGAVGIGVWRTAFSAELRDERPAKGTGWLAVAFVAGGLPGLASMAVQAFLQSIEPSPMPLGSILLFLQVDVAINIVVLAGCLVIFPWISQAASAWFDVVVQSRSPRPVLLLSVAMALLLVVGVFGLATFAILFAVLERFDGEDELSIYTYLLMAAPILVASVATWAFPFAASWWSRRRAQADGGQRVGDQASQRAPVAAWVFLDGARPGIANRDAPCLWAALSVGLYAGLFFWALWELYYYSAQLLPAAIGQSMVAAVRVLYAWSTDLLGNRAALLPASAAFFEILAAAIVAARATRLAELSGLFAAFAAGVVISAGDIVFFMEIGTTLPDSVRTIVIMMGPGALAAIAASIVAAWAGRRLRRTAYTAPANSGVRWQSLLSKAGLVILALLVATGMGVRLRKVTAAASRSDAVWKAAGRGDAEAGAKHWKAVHLHKALAVLPGAHLTADMHLDELDRAVLARDYPEMAEGQAATVEEIRSRFSTIAGRML